MFDFDTEKADADLCHLNLVLLSLFSLIKRSLLSATMVARSSSDIEGDREVKKCV